MLLSSNLIDVWTASAKRAIDLLASSQGDFHTEGEITFEDGTISCSSLQIQIPDARTVEILYILNVRTAGKAAALKQTTNCTKIKANGSYFGTSDIYFCSHKHIKHYSMTRKNEKGLNRAKSYAEREHEFLSENGGLLNFFGILLMFVGVTLYFVPSVLTWILSIFLVLIGLMMHVVGYVYK